MAQTQPAETALTRYAHWLRGLPAPTPSWSPGADTGADFISFTGGQPATELFPLEALRAAFGKALVEDGAAVLPYSNNIGLDALRQWICQRVARRGIHVGPDQVIVTTGSLQGLHLLGRVYLDPGDTILTEAPTFMGALNTWEKEEPRYLTVPVGADGLDLDRFEATVRGASDPPKFVYSLPTFQNPSGVSLTANRRTRLLQLAHDYDLLLIEDDPYGEIWFDDVGARLPALRSLDGAAERVVYLGSFSKILAPGLRLGFAIAPRPLIVRLVAAKEGVDFHTDGVVQQAIVRLCDGSVDFDLEAHITAARKVYRERRDAMLDALEREFGQRATWTRPAGGFFLWLDLPSRVDARDVVAVARAAGAGVLAGSMFFPNGGGEHALRLSYANTPPERIHEGVGRLARAIHSAPHR
jgi:2-aminoadipate transaminase